MEEEHEKKMLERHNSDSTQMESATWLQRLTSRLVLAHTDRGVLIMSRTRMATAAMHKGYQGRTQEAMILAAIEAAPEMTPKKPKKRPAKKKPAPYADD